MKTIQIFISLFTIVLLASCSGNKDVSFLGKPIKSPKAEFVKHLEENGFTYDYGSYKGQYLDEEVFIILGDEIDGHCSNIIVSAMFTDPSKAENYYEKLSKTLTSEFSGYKKTENYSDGVASIELTKEGSRESIKSTFVWEKILGGVVTVYSAE